MTWLLLIIAGIGEIIGVSGFERLTRGVSLDGLARLIGGFALGLSGLHFAMAGLPMAVAYGVYTAMGTVGATLLGIAFWGDPARPLRLVCIGAIVVAVIGIKATL
jgi:multidrug transporter EmrE-like cation transporter